MSVTAAPVVTPSATLRELSGLDPALPGSAPRRP